MLPVVQQPRVTLRGTASLKYSLIYFSYHQLSASEILVEIGPAIEQILTHSQTDKYCEKWLF